MIKKWLKVNKLEKVTCQLKIGDEYLCSLSPFFIFVVLSRHSGCLYIYSVSGK